MSIPSMVPKLGAFLCVLSLTTAASAQTGVSLAPYAGLNVDADELLIGTRVGIPLNFGSTSGLLSPGLEFYPGINGGSLVTFAVDLHFDVRVPSSSVSPYVGGGLILHRASFDVAPFGTISSTNSQVNAIGGMYFGSSSFRPFVEANLRFIDGSQFVIKGGGRIALGS